ncbi:uncharacterized protein V1478_004458 [Vespula squamosa]|uniref:Uncharacterized protein n=1 Tax=Vespula squamosa TaxID=30214 RepID=A0ABD2BGJ8_VESSQ
MYSTVKDYNFTLVNRWCDILRQIFRPHIRIEKYRVELDRVKDLHQAITDEERYRTNELIESQWVEIDEFPLNSFCDLPLKYNIGILPNTDKTITIIQLESPLKFYTYRNKIGHTRKKYFRLKRDQRAQNGEHA